MVSPTTPPRRSPARANAHARRAGCLALLALALASCGGPADPPDEARAAAPPDPAEVAGARVRLQELVERVQPPDPLWTPSEQDEALMAARSLLRELCASDSTAVGVAALELFDESDPADPRGRAALLEVAGHTVTARAAPRLAELVRRYDPETGLYVRTEAARILSEVAPLEARELFGELLAGEVNMTLPPQDLLVRYWADAAHRVGAVDPTLLADIATDLQRPADMRYAAIEELGRVRHPRSAAALRVLLVESGSDGYLRRKAAQSIMNLLSKEEACEIISEVADKESDGMFLVFLADMIERECE